MLWSTDSQVRYDARRLEAFRKEKESQNAAKQKAIQEQQQRDKMSRRKSMVSRRKSRVLRKNDMVGFGESEDAEGGSVDGVAD